MPEINYLPTDHVTKIAVSENWSRTSNGRQHFYYYHAKLSVNPGHFQKPMNRISADVFTAIWNNFKLVKTNPYPPPQIEDIEILIPAVAYHGWRSYIVAPQVALAYADGVLKNSGLVANTVPSPPPRADAQSPAAWQAAAKLSAANI